MKYVKLGFFNLSIPFFVQLCRNILGKMGLNANFLTPSPTLAVVKTAVDALETAYEKALTGGTLLTQDMYTKFDAVMELMRQLAVYVQSASGGDETKITSSGFGVRSTNHHASELTAPENLKAKPGTNAGEVDLKWKRVKGNKMYVVQSTAVADAQTGWGTVGFSTRAKFTVPGLIAGHKYWFRVVAQNSVGQSPYSDVTQTMVLG